PAREHPPCHPEQDPQAPLVDVLQDERLERQQLTHPHEPVDELRRVGRAAADDRELHVFQPFAAIGPGSPPRHATRSSRDSPGSRSRTLSDRTSQPGASYGRASSSTTPSAAGPAACATRSTPPSTASSSWARGRSRS